MFIKKLIGFAILIATFSVVVLGQTATTVDGTVEMDELGKRTPLAGAKVDIFPTDSMGQGKSVTTGADGKFSFTDLTAGKIYLISVSGPGAAPTFTEDVRPGMRNILITTSSGDGRSVTEDELKKAIAAAESQMSEADRKKKAEELAKRREIESRNQKIADTSKIVDASLKAGNAAFESKNYDIAVAKYDEGLQAEPDFVGIAPVLLNNKGTALNTRAVDNYNKNLKISDGNERRTANMAVRKDLSDAVDAFARSWEILKGAAATDIPDKAAYEANKLKALGGGREAFRLMVATELVDDTKGEIAKTILGEYVAAETDKAKRDAALLTLADVYRVAGDSANAIAEYRKVLETNPANVDAMAGLGLSLVNEGYLKDDKAILQEGANVLQQFATAAPANHRYKADAVALIENLKAEQNIAPQRAPARRRN